VDVSGNIAGQYAGRMAGVLSLAKTVF